MFGRKRIKRHGAAPAARGFDSYDLRLGDQMRGERATLGKSLMDVQRELRIKASYIAAIENAELEAFDSPSFIAGYVRSYARYLGMDPDAVFARFCAETGFGGAHSFREGPAATRPAEPPAPRARLPLGRKAPPDPLGLAGNPFARKATPAFAGFEPGALGSLLVLGALVGGLGYGGWLLVQEVQRVQVAPVEQEPMIVAELDPLAPVPAPEGAGIDGALDPVARADALNRLYRPRVLETPILQARDAPIATLPPGQPSLLAALTPVQPPPGPDLARLAPLAPPDAEAPTMTAAVDAALQEALAAQLEEEAAPQVLSEAPEAVVLMAVREAWVRVRDADGATLYEKVMAPGEIWEAPVTEVPATFDTGNAGAVYMAVNGQTYGPVGDTGSVVRRIPLAASPVAERFAVAAPEGDADLERVVAELARPALE